MNGSIEHQNLYIKKVVLALVMDLQFDVLFVIDDDNHRTKFVHDLSITAKHWQGDSEVEWRQTIATIENHFATMLPLSTSDPTAH